MKKIQLINIKRKIEGVIMYPFILLGKFIAILKPLDKEYDCFMFFSFYCIGGVEKVNAEIVASLPDKQIVIFFTRRSPDDQLLHLFKKQNVKIIETYKWTDNKLIHWANFIYRGICAQYINSQKKAPIVFNGQCNFGYKLVPHIKPAIFKAETIHNKHLKFAKITFPYIEFIDRRVTFSDCIMNKQKEYYREIGLPEKFADRYRKIVNCVNIPTRQKRVRTDTKRIYYVGRGGYDKRLELLFEIFRACISQGLDMEYHLAGTFEDEIPDELKSKIIWHGSISSEVEMYKLHQQMDILLMTSRSEGFPLVIAEAMSCGVAIVAPAIDGIPEHVKDGDNGYLIHAKEENEIVEEGVQKIRKLINDTRLLEDISENNFEYATSHFSKEVFARSYRKAFGLQN